MDYDILIIGAGPAGLTAGLYSSRVRLRVCCLEKLSPGGQAALASKIENYPGFEEPVSGLELCQRMEKHARSFGLEIITEEAEALAVSEDGIAVKSAERSFGCGAVIVASGARPRELGVPGERELRGKGVSYCATCDGPFFKDREVAVIGGGDSALEEAVFLARFCRGVHVIHRRGEFSAARLLVEKASEHERIQLATDSIVTRILGSEEVEAVEVKNLTSGSVRKLPVAAVFVYVGISPNSDFLPENVGTDEVGFVMTDEEMRTSVSGVFAAGDVRKKSVRQISTAVGDGAVAAMSAVRYLEDQRKRE